MEREGMEKGLFSHSRLSTFEQCPLKYKYKYLDKVEVEQRESVEAFLGSAVHATLEKLYRDIQFSKLNSLEELLSFYNETWKKKWNPSIVINRDYKEDNYRQMGEGYIKAYYGNHMPFNSSVTIGLEKKVIIEIDTEGKLKMQGFIDRLATMGKGVYEIHDYKTSLTLPMEDYLRRDRQLALYSIAVRKDYQDAREVKLIWHFLAFGKDYVIQKTDEELEKLRKDTLELIKKVQFTKDYPAKPSALCDWCEFKSLCPIWKHIVKTELLPANEFLKEPGVVLVNKYVELKAKRDEFNGKVNEEIERLEEALVEFSKREGVEVIAGSEFNARIKEYPKFSLPPKGEEKRELLEKLLKGYGIWDAVAEISHFSLSRAIQDGLIPASLLSQIKNFVEEGKTTRIYINKSKRED